MFTHCVKRQTLTNLVHQSVTTPSNGQLRLGLWHSRLCSHCGGAKRGRSFRQWLTTTFLLLVVIALPLMLAGALKAAQVPSQNSNRPVTLTSIQMFDEKTGWASASSRLLHTNDGGNTWHNVTPPSSLVTCGRQLSFFLDAQKGWATYYPSGEPFAAEPSVVWRTADGGQSWTPSVLLDTGDAIVDYFEPDYLFFTDARNGWLMLCVGRGMSHAYVVLFRTTDGGARWQLTLQPSSEQSGTLHVSGKTAMVFADAQTGVVTFGSSAYGKPIINWTFDSGKTWRSQSLPAPAEARELFKRGTGSVHSPVFLSAHLLAVLVHITLDDGMVSFIYRTRDNGATWQQARIAEIHDDIPFSSWDMSPWMLQFVTPEVGFALGRILYQTRDGGVTWQYLQRVPGNGIFDFGNKQFSFVNEQTGWAVIRTSEGTTLVHTNDGGETWVPLHPILAP